LVVNCGGATFKYKLYRMPEEIILAQGHVDRLGTGIAGPLKHQVPGKEDVRDEQVIPDHRAAIEWMLEQLVHGPLKVLSSLDEIDVVSHKIAHDGMKLGTCAIMGEKEIQVIRDMLPLAPIHNTPNLMGMKIFHELLPNVPQTGSFETGFHHTVPPEAYTYGLPYEWQKNYGVRRYGFHSCSHRYVSERCAKLMQNPQAKIICCHLGSGTSVAAINAGESINIASGLTPQCGVIMSTRPGDYDAGAVTYMMRQLGISLDEYDRIELRESGLKGVSGVASGDMRDVEEAMEQGNARAKLAFDIFCHQVRHYIGSYFVQLGGADAITFTAGIGENSLLMRAAVCRQLECIGAKMDENRNNGGAPERSIHAADSQVQLWVIPTNEEIIVARDAMKLING
ncbi:MAG: acetate/propionate family kinase, partial [Abditibacteriaceae bacterium]